MTSAALLGVILLTVTSPWTLAQNIPALPTTGSPLAEPAVRADALLAGRKATAWTEDSVKYLLLEQDVQFRVGVYGFEADRAVVRIATEQQPGRTVRHMAAYLDGVDPVRTGGAVSAQGSRILVTASTTGSVELETDFLQQADVTPSETLVGDALGRFSRYDQTLAMAMLDAPTEPLFAEQTQQRRKAGRQAVLEKRAEEEAVAFDEVLTEKGIGPKKPVVIAPGQGVLPTRGSVAYGAERIVFDQGEQENYLMLIGKVRLIYDDEALGRAVSLKAERAVVFLSGQIGKTTTGQELEAGDVRGVYLEDNVIATDGDYTVRAPRVYYDLSQNKAVLLEAVLYTFDVKRRVPLYVRADALRQTSRTSFEAEDAILTTSEFAEPHFAIGAGKVTFKQIDNPEGGKRQIVAAHDSTFNVGGVPVFYWPYIVGETQDIPLRSIDFGHSSQNGFELLTTWDLFALAGKERPDGVDMTGSLDYRGDHGPAIGANLEYDIDGMFGKFDGYLLPLDNGTDEIGQRNDIEHDDDLRGYLRWQHRQYLQNDWELSLEAAHVSDETFLEEFFPDEAYRSKNYETSLYLKKQQDEWAADLLFTGQLDDFTPQLTTLQTPGYNVEKLPELGYYRVGSSIFDNRVTWFSENRVSAVRAVFGDDTPSDRGFRNAAAQELFGIPSNVSFQDAADAAGFPDDFRLRLDTRQEFTAPLKAGIFDVTPYAVGRLTAYDEDFEDFNNESDQYRLWGSLGTRVHSQFNRSYNDFESQILDVHRLRHIIEPSVDLFTIGSTYESDDLPVYDQDVESLAEGTGVRFGLLNTLQTQRGGPGRWRSVDWISLQTDVVLRSDDADIDEEIARFYDYRPEFSVGGDHFYSRLLWMVSDTFGVTGELTHSFESDRVAQWRIGATFDHTPRLQSFVNYDEIDALDSRLLTYGFTYQLTSKYTVSFAQRLDFRENDSRDINVWLERRLPRWRLRVVASIDEVEDEQTIGVVLTPEGFSTGRSNVTSLLDYR